ncbi:S8 family peptidase [Nostoc sp. TCL26-01]|uniref:S8 family peptidase n=1 Tax=Nostoc sp. TCL26-01 TaxID=2576904 RepID=UPI0015C03EA3|nr:S8 family peptidase [Nostoc sp. TCL26-01]QLE56962.1 S8 family peptidase [Nostoc sp. TCL26-01]
MPDYQRNLPNFYIVVKGDSQSYTYPTKPVNKKPLPYRNRIKHAENLQQAFEKALENYQQQKPLREAELAVGEVGFYLEFQIQKSELKAVELLENKPKQIELLAVHSSDKADEIVSATVFVPEKASDFFPSKIEAYRDEETEKGNPKNEPLIACLEDINLGTVRALFTDNIEFPSESQEVWWEVWLRNGCRESFQQIAQILDIRTTENSITFPEREVVLALTSVTTLSRIINNNGLIAELRLAKDSPSMFFDMDMQEQASWVQELVGRTVIASNINLAVCLLDSGVTRSHRLIEPALAPHDLFTCNPSWGVADSKHWRGHGTDMAGLALYGNLYNALATSSKVYLTHRLESVKILPDQGENDPKLYGAITKEAVSRVEISNPKRQRVICMPVTSEIDNHKGVPSSWSAAVDQICFEFQRLMVIPVGNISGDIISNEYPNRNDVSQAENPSQAWNALVVGAYTDKVNISNSKYAQWQTIAPAGDLSPRSRTSLLWTDKWPIRPDVTFEGGNLATDDPHSPGMDIDDLRLLTTYYQPNVRQFNLSGDTSAATALCSYVAARIWAENPEYWAETVRALIVHSAEWTPAMYSHLSRNPSQKEKVSTLLRRYGYGVPSLERALFSSQNDLTMICEDQFQPFHKDGGKGSVKTKEMNLHILPWPTQELENLREAKVEMRVTLSYFIEPNPGERGWQNKHSYASYGLRFAIKRSEETLDSFRQRINKEARETEENITSTRSGDSGWFLGIKTWNRGSIHSDIWQGTAAELAQKDSIGIYPVSGWWKYNPKWEGWNKTARYALIVSIRVIDEVNVDIYTPISLSNKIKQTVPINL